MCLPGETSHSSDVWQTHQDGSVSDGSTLTSSELCSPFAFYLNIDLLLSGRQRWTCGGSSTGPLCVPPLRMTTQISSAFTVICLTGLLSRVAEPGMFGLPGSCSDLDIYANISGVMIDTTMEIGEAAPGDACNNMHSSDAHDPVPVKTGPPGLLGRGCLSTVSSGSLLQSLNETCSCFWIWLVVGKCAANSELPQT